MKKALILVIILGTLFLLRPQVSSAEMGMMGGYHGQPTPSQSDLQDEQNIQDAGQKVYQNLQDKKITCQQLTSTDFEKLGEYFMGQAAGSTQNHAYWDQRIQSMMGETGDTQMHIVWGERGSGCEFISGMMGSQTGMKGGAFPMMVWENYGWSGIAGGFGWGLATLGFLFWLIAFIDLILLGIFLWRQIRLPKKK